MGAMEVGGGGEERPTARVTNIPQTVTASELLKFLKTKLGPGSIFAVEIQSEHKNWKSRGYGRVQFSSLHHKKKVQQLSLSDNLVFKSHNLRVSETYDDIIQRPVREADRAGGGELHAGFMREESCMCVLESWEGVRAWVMPDRRRVEFWVKGEESGEFRYKLEVGFEDVVESVGCRLGDGDKVDTLLLKLKYGPKIYEKISGPDIASKFRTDRYHICEEDFDFLWVRTTDFTSSKAIGQASCFCWVVEEGKPASDIFSSFPYYLEDMRDFVLEEAGEEFGCSSEIVPLIKCGSDTKLAHEILFQLNSLVHTKKISLAAVDLDLIETLGGLTIDVVRMIVQQLHKLKSMCYNPRDFVKTQKHIVDMHAKRPASLQSISKSSNIMSCHRALITPTKIYCLGPEFETSNYVVKNFASYASDFMRVTFVDEDWSKLPPNAISASIRQGMFAEPLRTKLYHRILSILRDGIVMGSKRYDFLAFSASQLRSSSFWMFASNDKVTAKDIRDWMGCFTNIRSVSKCAARMGQLFSSSMQTFDVPPEQVDNILDIEVTSDGISYCFSDGIGKISLPFAREVAQKCGLDHTPSAFQIRYGGYKGVIAVDHNSTQKLSLRKSMLKFESGNRMLNVTNWTKPMPCYLNREIVTLLTTLGVRDEVFEVLQHEQLNLMGKMLSGRQAALDALENLAWADSKNILVKMLHHGYEPNVEPYLSMMLQAHHETLLAELRSRCRVFVPKGRILIGCLDEAGILDYGQVFIRLTMKTVELLCGDQSYFHKVNDMTSIITGKVVVTKNPCLHPGDVRLLEAVYHVKLEEKGLVDCILFPQKGERPHPNECSGGDLDGDQFFVSWDEGLIQCKTEMPMDYIGGRPRIMDHDVTMEEIQKFFVDYMINDTLGAISTAHLVHADREPEKASSEKCLQLANLHSMAVDFAKTGAPAEMPKFLKPKEFPDFMERFDKPMYISNGILGKLYRSTLAAGDPRSKFVWTKEHCERAYDHDLEVKNFEVFIKVALSHRNMYIEKMSMLMNYYDAKDEDEILTGNLRLRAFYLQRDNRRYGDMKDRILESLKSLQREAKGWFESSCQPSEQYRLASSWYHVTYHSTYFQEKMNCLSFPWIVGDKLLTIKSVNKGL